MNIEPHFPTFIPNLQQKIKYTKGHTLLGKKVPVKLVVLSGLLSSQRVYTDPTLKQFHISE